MEKLLGDQLSTVKAAGEAWTSSSTAPHASGHVSAASRDFMKIRDDFNADGQLDSIVLRARRNHIPTYSSDGVHRFDRWVIAYTVHVCLTGFR